MSENIEKRLYLSEIENLFEKGLFDGLIEPFDNTFYERLSHTYINCLPVSIEIKYLKSINGPGHCLDRSLSMFFCFDDALLVRGDGKYFELIYGKNKTFHGWIELDGYVYDPSFMKKIIKYLCLQIFQNVQ